MRALGLARLLDVKAGRSAKVLTDWLGERNQDFRDGVEVATMDGFAGNHTATKQALPQAVPVMNVFHLVHLAGEKLTSRRQRLQQQIHGRRGRRDDLLSRGRRTLPTRQSLLTDRQRNRLDRLWDAHDDHAALQVAYEGPLMLAS